MLRMTAITLYVAAACTGTGAARETDQSRGDQEVLATLDGTQITVADIRARKGPELEKIELQYQRSRSNLIEATLDTILRERVLYAEAKKQGKTIEDLVAAEVGGTFEPTDVEINAWYNDNKDKLQGRTVEQLRSSIADYLRSERRKEGLQKLEARLNSEHKLVIAYRPYRTNFTNDGAPTLGSKTAPVTVVEFSDFQCPFCQGFAPTLKRIEQNFGDKVYIVYRQFPIQSLHPNAFKAAEASLCANEQGRFWDLHDLMFSEQNKLAVPDLKEKARRLGLDRARFDACLDSGRYVEQIQRDLAEGYGAGATGTPALFINGRQLDGGAVPYEVVAKAIEQELARAANGSGN